MNKQVSKFLYKIMSTRFGWGLTAIFPNAFIGIVISLIQILTLGYYTPPWSFQWMCKITLFRLRLAKQIKNL